jgi:rod shape-determining protein MreC
MPLTGKGTAPQGALHKGSSSTGGRLLVVLLAVSAVLFTLSVREAGTGVLSTARNTFQMITTPVRQLGMVVTSPVRAVGNIMSNLTADQETLSELQAEIDELRARNAELEEAARATESLEALLDLKSAYSLESTGARIISGSTDSWSATVTIDKGTSSGIAVGMPVTDSVGAIGQVIECNPASATVRLITDENSGVSAMVQSSRAQGMLRGSATGSLRLTLIRTDQQVEVGDTVITSGLGGVYPKGLPLGKVSSVEKAAGALYYTIVVEPVTSAESLEEVLVITSLTDEQKATAEDIASADAQESSALVEGRGTGVVEQPEADEDAASASEGE